jgi:hypothetical protein
VRYGKSFLDDCERWTFQFGTTVHMFSGMPAPQGCWRKVCQ